jgi:hypothetical protein
MLPSLYLLDGVNEVVVHAHGAELVIRKVKLVVAPDRCMAYLYKYVQHSMHAWDSQGDEKRTNLHTPSPLYMHTLRLAASVSCTHSQ